MKLACLTSCNQGLHKSRRLQQSYAEHTLNNNGGKISSINSIKERSIDSTRIGGGTKAACQHATGRESAAASDGLPCVAQQKGGRRRHQATATAGGWARRLVLLLLMVAQLAAPALNAESCRHRHKRTPPRCRPSPPRWGRCPCLRWTARCSAAARRC